MDADHRVALDHRKPLDVLPLHQPHRFFERGVVGDRHDVSSHYLLDLASMRLRIFRRKLARGDEEFDPSGATPLGSDLGATQEIALGDDPDKPAAVHHREAAQIVLQHQLRRLPHRIAGRDRNHPARHHLGHFHNWPL
jgi:hypothetical protein